MYANSEEFASRVIYTYLFGQDTLPAQQIDESWIGRESGDPAQSGYPWTIGVSLSDYMAGPGRFALLSESGLVRAFFGMDFPILDLPQDQEGNPLDLRLTKSELLGILTDVFGDNGQYRFDISSTEYDDGYDDYALRSFIWNSMSFSINEDAVFVFESSGSRYIENVGSVPVYERDSTGVAKAYDNFDFVGGDLVADITNFIDKPLIDPFDIGRTVRIDIESDHLDIPNATYSLYDEDDFESDQTYLDSIRVSTPDIAVKLAAGFPHLLDLIYDPGLYVQSELDVMYGTNSEDVIASFGGWPHKIFLNEHGKGSAILAGAGDDYVIAAGAESHLWGGSGKDVFAIGSNAVIHDADSHDKVFAFDNQLFGGIKQWWMEGNTAYWSPFSSVINSFPVIGSSLLTAAAFFVDVTTMKFVAYQRNADGDLEIRTAWGLGGTTYLKDYSLDLDSGVGSGGITVFQQELFKDVSFEHFKKGVNLALKAGFGVGLGGVDPLVLDLDDDGFELTTEGHSGVHFEFDGDGFGERTGWVRGDDGFLALDANLNGVVDDLSELFGDEATAGFAELASHDANADGVIDASDAVFADLRVWQDHDQDGVTDAGELKTLAELGITSIGLANAAPSQPTQVAGNTIVRTGSFTRNGQTHDIADVAFSIDQLRTRWLGDTTVSSAAAALPEVRGRGEVKDLRLAMTGDAALLTLVSDFSTNATTDLAVLKAAAEDILYAWAGVGTVAADALGTHGFDERKLAFLEKYAGVELMPRNGSGIVQLTNLSEMEALWNDQVMRLTLRLVVQGPLADEFAGISYNKDYDLLVADTPAALGDVYASLLEDLPSDPEDALAQWEEWAPLLGAMADGMVRHDNNVVRDDFIAAQLLAAMDGIAQPLDFAALATALGIDDLRIGSSGNDTLARGSASEQAIYLSGGGTDTLNGGVGQDVFIFGQAIGNVVINDSEAKATGDRIRFAFLSAAEVSMARDDDDLVITVTATGETVRVTGQFADVVPLSSDVLISANRGVEEIQFADGEIFEIPDIMIAVGKGTSGNDHLVGTMHSDALQGGLGNDLLEGGDDADLYVVNAGEGQDVIRDIQTTPLLRAADMLIFGDGIAPEDLVFSRGTTDANDLLITIGASGQSILIDNQFAYTSLGYNHKWSPNSRIEAFGFREYGDGWSNTDVQQMMIGAATTDGDDTALGFGDADTFGTSAGNDVLRGLDGADTYMWGSGAGNDIIDEQAEYIDVDVGLGGISLTVRADTVLFAPELTPADVTFSRTSSAPHLTITIVATGETLTVKNQFAGFQTGMLGAQWTDRVEWFEFGDGTKLNWQQVLLDVTTGGTGNDSLWGDLYQDTFSGGAGDDYASGGGYADTYLFNVGDGQDTIEDNNAFLLGSGFVSVDATPDILRFGEDIDPDDITFSRSGTALTLLVGAGTDKVTLLGQNDYFHTGVFGAYSYDRIERVEFHDGTVWTWRQLNAFAIADATTSGDDVIDGFKMVDRFAASAGNDIMSGGDSGDVYEFGEGSGHDIIRETVSNIFYGDYDVIEFAAGILPEDVEVSRVDNHLILTLIASGETLTVESQFTYYVGSIKNDIEEFRFADGTVWSIDDVRQMLVEGTSGPDHLIGTSVSDYLDGGEGDDILEGGDGADTYGFGVGYGHDIIRESVRYVNLSDFDVIEFALGILPEDVEVSRVGNHLILTLTATGDTLTVENQFTYYVGSIKNDIEEFRFANGTVWSIADVRQMLVEGTPGHDHLIGTSVGDHLDGGAGDDILEGGDGADTYYFGIGHGEDFILERVHYVNISDYDTLVFGSGIVWEDLILTREGVDLRIGLQGTPDTVTIPGQLGTSGDTQTYTWRDVENFVFSNGVAKSKNDIFLKLLEGTSGDDSIVGFYTPDTIAGGLGDDLLQGGRGNDIYVHNVGDGHDTVADYFDFWGSYDDVVFGPGITPDDVAVIRPTTNSPDIVLDVLGGRSSVTLKNQANGGSDWIIDRALFNDGTIWTAADIAAQLSGLGTSANDTMTGTEWGDHLYGLEGNDSIDGRYGDDTLYGDIGNDTLLGHVGDDMLMGEAGDDVLGGDEGADTLVGGIGNDILSGDKGADTYIFNVGDGQDTIREYRSSWDTAIDTLEFGAGIATGDITVVQVDSGNDLVLKIASTTDQVTLDTTVSNVGWRVDQVKFTDGTVWSYVDLLAKSMASNSGNDTFYGDEASNIILGGAGNDTLYGRQGADTLIGGAGDDILSGDQGADTYVFNLGDGQDIIREHGTSWDSAVDTIEFGAGIAPGDVTVTQVDGGNDLVLKIVGTTDQIILDTTITNVGWRVDQVKFANGNVWSHADLLAKSMASNSGNDTFYGDEAGSVISGGAGNDTLYGRQGADTLIGGGGNDILSGDQGTDTYVFNLGDGQDIIREYGTSWDSAIDTVEFGAGIAPGDVTVTQADGGNDLVLKIGATDQITLDSTVTDMAGRRVDQVKFADGTLWSHTDLLAKATGATAGNDTLYGSSAAETLFGGAGDDTLDGRQGNDILIGGTGNDILSGSAGADTYIFALGDGQDIIREYGSSWDSAIDTVEFSEGIAVGDVSVAQADSGNDFVLKITGTSDQITLDTSITDTAGRRVDHVRFADGTLWSHADLLVKSIVATTGNDTFYGDEAANTLLGGAGDDTLDGRQGNDILIGGTGNDILSGSSGADTYLFALGDGQDIIRELGSSWDASVDTVEFAEGIAAADVTVTQADSGNDFILKIMGTSDQITLDTTITDTAGRRIDQVRFADGTSWSHADLLVKSIVATTGNDTFYGDEVANTVSGGAGNDTLYGRQGADTLIGSTGNDILSGDQGADTYVFNLGDGQDIIREYGTSWDSAIDTVEFGVGIAVGNVTVTQTDAGNDFVLKIAGTSDEITLDTSLSDTAGRRVDQVRFADGTLWTHADLLVRSITPTTGSDTFYGDEGHNSLSGGDGNDFLYGRDGTDTLQGGAGNDTLNGGNHVDTVDYSERTVAIIVNLATTTAQTVATGESDTITNVENVTGGSGDDTLTGSTAANHLKGGDGNDRLNGGTGNDTIDGGLGSDVAVFAGLQASYSVTTTGGVVKVIDNQASADGNDGTDTIIGIETLEFKGGVQVGVTSPIILDLNGDGIETFVIHESGASFDLDGDGQRDKASWIGNTDGFLFLDRNGDGTLTDAGELSFVDDVPGAASDLAGLLAFDSDGNGVLSSDDARFGDFKIWNDRNVDGQVDDEEVLALQDAKVASIKLSSRSVEQDWELDEVLVVGMGAYERTDGLTMQFYDAALTYLA